MNGQAIVLRMMVMEMKTTLKTSFAASSFIVTFVNFETVRFDMLQD